MSEEQKSFWKPLAIIVVLIYSVIFWFGNYIAALNFGMEDTIMKSISWVVTSVIIIVGSIVVDWGDAWIGSFAKGEDLWEKLGKIVAILVSIIFWFTWLGTMDFTMSVSIMKAVTWIVVTLIIVTFANVLGFVVELIEKALPKPKPASTPA